jgi:hypothetical protein
MGLWVCMGRKNREERGKGTEGGEGSLTILDKFAWRLDSRTLAQLMTPPSPRRVHLPALQIEQMLRMSPIPLSVPAWP